MDRHVREFYHLKKAAVTEPWQRAEFLRIISAAGAKQGKVFTWRVPSARGGTQATYAVLYNDPGTKRWVRRAVLQGGQAGSRVRHRLHAHGGPEGRHARGDCDQPMTDSKVHCGLYDPDRSTDDLLFITTEAAREARLGPDVGASVVPVPFDGPGGLVDLQIEYSNLAPELRAAMDRDGITPGGRDHVRAAGHRRCGP